MVNGPGENLNGNVFSKVLDGDSVHSPGKLADGVTRRFAAGIDAVLVKDLEVARGLVELPCDGAVGLDEVFIGSAGPFLPVPGLVAFPHIVHLHGHFGDDAAADFKDVHNGTSGGVGLVGDRIDDLTDMITGLVDGSFHSVRVEDTGDRSEGDPPYHVIQQVHRCLSRCRRIRP